MDGKSQEFEGSKYDTEEYADGSQKSTLTLSALTTSDTSDSIECYDDTIGISGKATLVVVGTYFS